MRIDYYTKAIGAALGAGYALFNVATGDGSPAGAGVTLNEWVGIAVTVVLVGLATWALPNTLTPEQVNTAVAKAVATGTVVATSPADPPVPVMVPVVSSANIQP
jgi:hypothetical protein